ncbi:MAG TPA: ABC transporter permease [Spirochaetia bacterium]|nr:ABC transporter permease [Spirochaetia bacterium]
MKLLNRNLGWIFYVSRRYLRTRRREKGHTASVLSVAGIAAGVMTLIVVLAVMNGFQLTTIRSILEVNSYHLRVTVTDDNGVDGALLAKLRGVPGVTAVVPFVDVQTVAQGYFSAIQAISLRGVPKDALAMDPSLVESLKILAGEFDLSTPGNVVLGSELARSLGLRVGDEVTLLSVVAASANPALQSSASGESRPRFRLVGIFRTGFYDYDLSWGFVSIGDALHDFGTAGPVVYGVKLRNRFADQAAERRIRDALPATDAGRVQIESWRQYNKAIFGALDVEKTTMMLLVGLIFLVVGVNIYQSLRRSVYERTEDIGVMRATGAPPWAIQLIFIFDGFYIGFLGSAIGTVVGLFLSVNINGVFAAAESVVNGALALGGPALQGFVGMRAGEFSIFSPSYFYLSAVPVKVVFGEVYSIFLFAVLSATIAGVFAARRATRIKPAYVLRYE